MIAILAVAGLLVAYGTFGAGRAGWHRRSERRDERAAQAARECALAARPTEVVIAEIVRVEDDHRAREWRTGYDAYIADLNARFDALVAGMPLDDDAPFDAGYWPPAETPGGPASSADLTALAEFEPTVVLAIVAEAGAQPTVFSWQTGELPLVERPVCGALSTLRPRRRRATLRRALGASIQPTTF